MRSSKFLVFSSLALTYLLLTACTAPGNTGGTSGSSASSSTAAQSSSAQQTDLPESDFHFNEQGNPEGTIYVRGYATVEQVDEPFCEEGCKKYDYVFFNVSETGNGEFQKFLEQNEGNAVSGIGRFGLGCVENRVIVFENHSDRYGRREAVISDELSSAILQSTQGKPIALKLVKERLSSGSGAPACYSHFADVTMWTGASSSSAASTPTTSTSSPSIVSKKKCVVSGCSGQLCVQEGDDGISTCEWREEYACYKTATCTQQANGECGWTQTAQLTACIQDARL